MRDVTKVLVEHGISGLPVCDEQRRVIGVISDGDLLFKEHDPTAGTRGVLAWLFDSTSHGAVQKSRARTAGEAMSSPPLTISPGRSIAEAARLMVERGDNRLPVVSRA